MTIEYKVSNEDSDWSNNDRENETKDKRDDADIAGYLLPYRAGPVHLLAEHLLTHQAVHHRHGPHVPKHSLVLPGKLAVTLNLCVSPEKQIPIRICSNISNHNLLPINAPNTIPFILLFNKP